MFWQIVNRFGEELSDCLRNFLTFREYLMTFLIILGAVYYWNSVLHRSSCRSRLINFASTLPGPRTLPIIGNALEFACKTEDTLKRVIDLCQRYESPFRIWLGPKLFVVLTEPRDYEVILSSGKAAYKDAVYRFMEPLIGQGLVSGSGPRHKAHRKIIMPMMNNKVLSIYLEFFERHSRHCADLLEKHVDVEEFDISSYMAHCTTDIMLDTILGSPGTSRIGDYKELLYWTERSYKILHTRMMKVWLHYDKIFFITKLGDDHNKGVNFIHSFVESVIKEKKKEHYSIESGAIDLDRPRVMLLEQLIAHSISAKDMDDIEIRDEIYTVFTAAQDTSSVIASFAFMMLAMHPEIQDRLREELNDVLKNETIKNQHLPNLRYLEMVIRETIRLFPIAPLMVRQLKGDLKLETCTLPDGCSVVMVPFVTHRHPKYWKEPEKFMPERFLPKNSVGRHPYANVSFSGGIRGCIGQKFVIMCLKTIIANVVRRFRLSSEAKYENLRLEIDISVRSQTGYKLSLTKIH